MVILLFHPISVRTGKSSWWFELYAFYDCKPLYSYIEFKDFHHYLCSLFMIYDENKEIFKLCLTEFNFFVKMNISH